MGANLWGPALLLAKLCGEAAFRETAAAMASQQLQPGTPLQALLGSAFADDQATVTGEQC